MQVHTRSSHGPCFTSPSHESQRCEHAGIDSRSLEEPEAALSFGPIFFVSRAARIRLVPPYNVSCTIEPVATSRPVV
jgi:hypothetical protein